MKPIFRFVKHNGIFAVKDIVCYFFAAVCRQAISYSRDNLWHKLRLPIHYW